MGPFARLDYGSRGGEALPVPSWSRMDIEGQTPTRAFSLPCNRDKVHGDIRTPFTCGSESRRAVIKYFVRDFAQVSGTTCSTDNVNQTLQDVNKQRVLNLVREKLGALYDAWSDPTKLQCEEIGPDGNLTGNHGFQYCNSRDSDTWEPTRIKNWDNIAGAQVTFLFITSSLVGWCLHRHRSHNPSRLINIGWDHFHTAGRRGRSCHVDLDA